MGGGGVLVGVVRLGWRGGRRRRGWRGVGGRALPGALITGYLGHVYVVITGYLRGNRGYMVTDG